MSAVKTRNFFESGSANQFEWVLQHYDECLRLKAENKSSKPENVIKLDNWYQNELPKKIKSRGKDPHLNHEEIVQTIKWKLARGKFRPNLTNLVRMNTPRVVMQETKKAFRKIAKNRDIHSAMSALCNLKGVGPAMASAVLSAGAPELAPFMADECLLAMPDVDSLDYTMREYMRFVEYVKSVQDRLNAQSGSRVWDPHSIELAVWTHNVASDLKPELLSDMPTPTSSSVDSVVTTSNGGEEENKSSEVESATSNGSHEEESSPPTDNGTKDESNTEKKENGETIIKTNGNAEEGGKTNGTSKNSSEILSSTESENTNDSTVVNNESSPNNETAEVQEDTVSSNTSQKRSLEVDDDDTNDVESKGKDEEEPLPKKAKEANDDEEKKDENNTIPASEEPQKA